MSAIDAKQEPTSRDDTKETVKKLPYMEIAKRTAKEFSDDGVTDIAAGVAYHAIFAIPPMLIFLITLAALVDAVASIDLANRLSEMINEHAPAETQELLNDLVNSAIANVSGGVASFGVNTSALVALWSGSNGIATIMRAFNRAYDVNEDRPWIKQKLTAIGLTILTGILIILAVGLFVFGQQIGSWVAEQVGLGSAFEMTWNILRWPLAIAFIMFLLAVLYYLGPNIEQSFRWISPGSVVATLIWIAIASGFSIYVNIANPGSAYGAVGGVIVLLFFLYLSAIAFLIGAELNAVIQRRYDEKMVEYLAENPEKLEHIEDRMDAKQNARDLEEREGKPAGSVTNEPDETTRLSRQPSGRSTATRPRQVRSRSSQGRAHGVGQMIGGGVLAFVTSKLRRKRKG